MTFCEMAELIEAKLKADGDEDLIPKGGLDHWVAQAWDGSEDAGDVGEWVETWKEQVADARTHDED